MVPINDEEIEVLDLNDTEKKSEPKEVKHYRKTYYIIIITIFFLASLSYYFIIKNNSQNNFLKEKMKAASMDYFEKYISTNDSSSAYIVTLNMLKRANNQGENYDLNGFEKCKLQSTLALISINYKDGKPKEVEVELNC